jgi:alpha-galactosidase
MTTRRSFLRGGAAMVGGAPFLPAVAQGKSTFLELLRKPDSIAVYTHFEKTLPAELAKARVDSQVKGDSLILTLSSSTPVAAVHVRWRSAVPDGMRVLGDAWERSYGELGWRGLVPERVLPWYFATWDGETCHSYGVKTGAAALCFWQIDPEGVSLWLNVTNGGNGVELGERTLTMATVVTRRGPTGESPHQAIAGLCRAMCSRATRPIQPIYGANDWNYSYGNSTAETILRDTEFIAEVSPTGSVRPFSVVDGGWAEGTAAWPDMARLASGIKQHNVRPGIWIRPLEAPPATEAALLLPGSRFGERKDRALAYDPTIPEAQERILAKMQQAVGWGYEMVKHDFSTYDLLGQWGFQMGPQPTLPGWSLHDRTQTNAEVMASLYTMLRQAAGEHVVVDGCNTVGHLGQGIFDMQRTGDDTSGRQWERTRRMGINTLAFRLPQHGTFFTVDPDMVGITDAIPWELNRQLLNVLAHSGVATIVAPGPPARGKDQRAALREAFAVAAAGGEGSQPMDALDNSTPERWRRPNGATPEVRYRWSGAEGASAFLAP